MDLLVSVRNFAEAQTVARSRATIIDLKEPRHGSLGAASPDIAREIAHAFAATRQLSAAMGELPDFSFSETNRPDFLRGFRFAKIGLAGCGNRDDWQSLWSRWAATVRPFAAPVVVCYADHRTPAAPCPKQVVELACRVRPPFFLIDTWQKDGRCLFDFISVAELRALLEPLRKTGVGIALAGSLTAENLDDALLLDPDLVAVRGAVCETGNRLASICGEKIDSLCHQLGERSLHVTNGHTNGCPSRNVKPQGDGKPPTVRKNRDKQDKDPRRVKRIVSFKKTFRED